MLIATDKLLPVRGQHCCSLDRICRIVPDRVVIYALADPADPLRVRYVGKCTGSLMSRMRTHLSHRNRRKTPKNDWINFLRKQGKRPIAWALEFCTIDEWEQVEREWILFYRRFGNLLNVSDGGDSGPSMKGYRHSDESKKKISEASKSAYLRGCFDHLRGKPAWNRGVSPPPHEINRLRNLRKGVPVSEAAKEKARRTLIGRKRDPEVVERAIATRTANNRWYRRYLCVETGIVYPNITLAGKSVGRSRATIGRAVKAGLPIEGVHFRPLPHIT